MSEETNEVFAWLTFLLVVAATFAWCAIGEALLP